MRWEEVYLDTAVWGLTILIQFHLHFQTIGIDGQPDMYMST